jgi:hypothetical protein
MLQVGGGMERVNPFYPKNATMLGGWKGLTLFSPVMPCDIILLILSFICYNFGELKRVNPFHPKKCYNFFGLERVNPFQPPKIVAYEEQN